MRILLDANAALRYLLRDNEEMAEKSKSAISYGAFLLPEVLAEVVYVLGGVYSVPRREISEKLSAFVDEVECDNPEVLQTALRTFGEKKLDFVDCILYAYHSEVGDSVLTFDRDLKKLLASQQAT